MPRANKYLVNGFNVVRDEPYVVGTCIWCGQVLENESDMFCPEEIGRDKKETKGYMGITIPTCKFDANVTLRTEKNLLASISKV